MNRSTSAANHALLLHDSKSKSVFEKAFLVAQATRLCRPATRRTEWEQWVEPMGTAFSQECSPQFRSAGRRPERASRPLHPFLKHPLRLRVRVRSGSKKIPLEIGFHESRKSRL